MAFACCKPRVALVGMPRMNPRCTCPRCRRSRGAATAHRRIGTPAAPRRGCHGSCPTRQRRVGSCNVSEQNEQSKLHRFVTCRITDSGRSPPRPVRPPTPPVTVKWCPAVNATGPAEIGSERAGRAGIPIYVIWTPWVEAVIHSNCAIALSDMNEVLARAGRRMVATRPGRPVSGRSASSTSARAVVGWSRSDSARGGVKVPDSHQSMRAPRSTYVAFSGLGLQSSRPGGSVFRRGSSGRARWRGTGPVAGR